MHLSPTDAQREIVDAVADMLAAEAPFDRWYRPQLDALAEEQRLLTFGAEMGWTGFAAPEDVGGAGADIVDEMLVFRRIGARIGPVGLCAAAVGVHVALACGDAALARSIVAGATGVAIAVGSTGMLVGGAADIALLVDGDRLSLHDVSAAAPRLALDWTSALRIAPLGAERGSVASVALALRFQLLIAAQLQGLTETAVAESNAFAKLREQFGKPIGSFQAVRHRIADMELRARATEAQLAFAAVALRDNRPDAVLQVLSALLLAGQKARTNAEVNIQNHGAIGTTTENIAHLLLKRALLWSYVVGDDTALLDQIAAADPALL